MYRSSNANDVALIDHLNKEFSDEETCSTIMVCADWNICHKDQKGHASDKFMMDSGFKPCQNPPKATHREGRCIDMIWMKSIV